MASSYKDSKHWLHQAYERGFQAALDGDEYCPHVGREKDWWEAGWSEGIIAKNDRVHHETRNDP